ncbi:MAG: DUF1844 domain-containing protein [Ignavibacteria bacterium]|jgi:hypothetical protein|nr:hypothetical protein LBMAG35_05310 [Chlorobiota bacterium]
MNIDFTGIVQMFQLEGFTALGKIAHPMTGKTERNPEQASFVIDLLAILQEKTAGNLTDTESRLLDTVLRDLRLNYVADTTSPAASNPDTPGDLS